MRVEGVIEPRDIPSLFRLYGHGVWEKRLNELARPRPPVINASTKVREAVSMMVETGYTTLLVGFGGSMGVFTSWDVLQAVEPDEVLVPAAAVASGIHPILSNPDGSLETVLEIMAERGVQTALIGQPTALGYVDSMSALEGYINGRSVAELVEPVEVYASCDAPLSAIASAMVDSPSRASVLQAGWRPVYSFDEHWLVEALAKIL